MGRWYSMPYQPLQHLLTATVDGSARPNTRPHRKVRQAQRALPGLEGPSSTDDYRTTTELWNAAAE